MLTSPVQSGGRFFTRGNVRGYRFGFNGKEKVDEVYGDANAYDFGARIYDPRLGRWLAVDPLAMKYPGLSPYNFVANSPLMFVDPDGESIKPLNSDAAKVIHTTLSLFGDEKQYGKILQLSTNPKTGVMTSNLIKTEVTKTGVISRAYSPKEFQKHLNDNGIKLKGEEFNDAYNVYSLLASSEMYELAVFSAENDDGAFTYGPPTGGGGATQITEGTGLTTNANMRSFERAFKNAKDAKEGEPTQKDVINKAITNPNQPHGEGWGVIGYSPEVSGKDFSHKGTIIIDGTGSNVKGGVETLKRASKTIVEGR